MTTKQIRQVNIRKNIECMKRNPSPKRHKNKTKNQMYKNIYINANIQSSKQKNQPIFYLPKSEY